MAQFLVRVELHNAVYADYETLHQAMTNEGFSKVIPDNNNVKYILPTAEYWLNGNFTLQQVYDKANRAAQQPRKAYSLIVVESVGAMWNGLKLLTAQMA